MKKIIVFLIAIMFLSGCGENKKENNMKIEYQSMKIGDKVESYQLDLRIYGDYNNNTINEIYKIDNYKNEEYTVLEGNSVYYVVNGMTYKGVDIVYAEGTENFEEFIPMQPQKTNENVFKDTDLILQGLINIEAKEKIENDLSILDLTVYSVKLKDNYVKKLLKILGYGENYKECNGKIYLKDGKVYKIVYIVDGLTINGTFFRVNAIRKLNIDFSNIK